MFVSFFPNPKPFFTSAAIWSLVAVLFWFFVARNAGQYFGLPNPPPGAEPIIGVSAFWSAENLWFYIYFAFVVGSFSLVWYLLDPNPWFSWSVLGSSLIIFLTYYSVQVDVVLNGWNGTFGDLLQAAVSKSRPVDTSEFYLLFKVFLEIVLMWACIQVLQNFFVKHFIFRWRTAMNNFYVRYWPQLRTIEGASQRIQEDTMKFADDLEGLGTALINSLMKLIAFLPIMLTLSTYVTELPVVGKVPYPLVVTAILWTVFGTGLLAIVGKRLPGLEFKNQRVEAAYRKELVLGENDYQRADPITLAGLFDAVRKNYFTLYVNYVYFNFARFLYLNIDNIFGTFILVPSLVSGAITLGILNRITLAMDNVRNSFQFLINAWPDLVKMYSTYKRLRAFEATIEGEALAPIESDPKIN